MTAFIRKALCAVLGLAFDRLALLASRFFGKQGIDGKPPFRMTVHGAGAYTSDSFVALVCEVIAHRLYHLANGDGWID